MKTKNIQLVLLIALAIGPQIHLPWLMPLVIGLGFGLVNVAGDTAWLMFTPYEVSSLAVKVALFTGLIGAFTGDPVHAMCVSLVSMAAGYVLGGAISEYVGQQEMLSTARKASIDLGDHKNMGLVA